MQGKLLTPRQTLVPFPFTKRQVMYSTMPNTLPTVSVCVMPEISTDA